MAARNQKQGNGAWNPYGPCGCEQFGNVDGNSDMDYFLYGIQMNDPYSESPWYKKTEKEVREQCTSVGNKLRRLGVTKGVR